MRVIIRHTPLSPAEFKHVFDSAKCNVSYEVSKFVKNERLHHDWRMTSSDSVLYWLSLLDPRFYDVRIHLGKKRKEFSTLKSEM